MKIDLHIHTSRYSRCSIVEPAQLIEMAVRRRLDAVVLTEHDAAWPAREMHDRLHDECLRCFTGIEVSGADGHHYLVYGPELGGFFSGMDPVTIDRQARLSGAAMVLAHPFRYTLVPPEHLAEVDLCAVELSSTNMSGVRERVLADRLIEALGCAGVGGSDAHCPEAVGLHYTVVKRPVETTEQLVQALQAGEVEPMTAQAEGRWDDLVQASHVRRIARAIRKGTREFEVIKGTTGAPAELIEKMLSDCA
ncbi:MAG: PHP-associated domain-containing protein [Planctomycetota bacterium]